MNARDEMERFEKHCASRGVILLPHQRLFAEAFLASDEQRKFMCSGVGSGKTLTLSLLESYFELLPRGLA